MFEVRNKDLLYGAINGAIFGLMAPFVLKSFHFPASEITFFFGFSALATFGILIGALLSNVSRSFFQLAKFGSVGAANFAIDFGVFNILLLSFGISSGWGVSVFASVSFVFASVNSYFWNRNWSFQGGQIERTDKEFFQFFVVSLAGAIISVGITTFFTNIIGPQGGISAQAWPNIGKAIGSIVVLMWNFLGYKYFVFKR